jgi:hypothetical protein
MKTSFCRFASNALALLIAFALVPALCAAQSALTARLFGNLSDSPYASSDNAAVGTTGGLQTILAHLHDCPSGPTIGIKPGAAIKLALKNDSGVDDSPDFCPHK